LQWPSASACGRGLGGYWAGFPSTTMGPARSRRNRA
jgi:hypothetical protein